MAMLVDGRIPEGLGWDRLGADFRWPRPRRFNIAEICCDRHARRDPSRLALRYVRPGGDRRDYDFGQLARASRRLANAFAGHGIGRGDRIALLLPQTPETLLTHLAAYRLGAVVVPLSTLFGEDGLGFRLRDSGAKAVVTDGASLPKVVALRGSLPDLRRIFSIDARESGIDGF